MDLTGWVWTAVVITATLMSRRADGQGDAFYFSAQPADVRVVQGESATLRCDVSHKQAVAFYWTLDGEPVRNTSRRFQRGSELHVTRVDPSKDIGEFKCIATNVTTGFSIASQGAQLNILWIGERVSVEAHSPTSPAAFRVGGEMSLRCRAEGAPEPQLEWYRNGVRLFRSERVTLRGRRLQVTSLGPRDNGVYSCRAVNEAGAVASDPNFTLVLPGDNVPAVVTLPSDVTVRQNESARLDCVYRGAAVTEWYSQDGDVPLANSSVFSILPNSSLVISSVGPSEEGLYRCVGVGEDKSAPQQMFVAHVRLAFLEDFEESSIEPPLLEGRVAVVAKNRQLELTCVVPGGHPRPRAWWEDPAGRVVGDLGRIRVADMRLLFDSVRKGDAGNYACVAENLAGTRRAEVRVLVAVPPSITSHPLDLTVDEGDATTLSCSHNGSPYPVTRVTWQHDGKPLRDIPPRTTTHNNGTLVIRGAVLSDAGEYRCEVNTTGFPVETSKVATLHVREMLKFVPPPVSRKLELGSNSKIHCKARGSPPPIVRWIKEGQQPYLEWPPHIRDDNGTLRFEGVRHEDVGQYTCVATSTQGLINTTIQVDVIVMPRFTVQPTATRAVEGYPAMLHCKATGHPAPAIHWDRNNVLNNFDPKRFTVLKNGTLLISEVYRDDDGKYGCTAGNSGGLRRVEASLVVAGSENYLPGSMAGDQGENTMTKTVTITLGAAAIYMMLVMGLMIWCRFRRARRKAMMLLQATSDVAKSDDDCIAPTELRDKGRESAVRSDGDAHSHSSGSQHPKRSRSSYDKLQFSRHDLQTMMLLGRGEFGDVFLAKTRSTKEGEADAVVMVKALQSREERAHADFKREMDTFHRLNHEGIVRLVGVSRDTEPFLAIMEYTDWGDLKQFLLATQKDSARKGPKPPPLSQAQAIAVCHQAALAMEHLSSHRLIHRDLAARNCLVTSRLDIKVGCPALSRDTYAAEYFRHQNQVVPLRWTPAEALFEDEWSTKSDVYSFGVLVWETFSRGALPHADKDDRTVLTLLRSAGLHWTAPDNVPIALAELLSRCWERSPKDRPSFGEVVARIGEIFVDSNV